MKRAKLIFILTICVFNIKAQWFTNGNNLLPADFLGSTNNAPIRFRTSNIQRGIFNGLNNLNLVPGAPYPNGDNTGYLALGDPTFNSPLFHMSVQTPALNNWGELLIGASISDVPRSYAALMNPALINGVFLPTFYGHLDSSQTGPAISTVGNIDPLNDLGPGGGLNNNNFPVHRFIVAKGVRLYSAGGSNISEINNRIAFTWQNNSTIKMMMNAAGRLRIGSALNIPGNLPNNRVEITSSPGANPALNDPYFGTVNGSSGLRFTNLTSANIPVANGINGVNNQRLLTVDQNGDVVLANAPVSVPTANQGLIVGPGNNVQLGDVCGTPAQMNGNRAINMNNSNFVWGNGRVGFGLANLCAVGNRVEITGLAANQSGLRLTNMTTTTSTIPNPGSGVLSVDNNGDVIYVPDAFSNIIGNNGISYNNGVVQLGVPCTASPNAKNQNAINVPRVIKTKR